MVPPPEQPASDTLWVSWATQLPLADSPNLASLLADELARRWHAGSRCRVEEILAEQGELDLPPEVVVPLIYEEICQRQEAGETPSLQEYQQRFPRWRQQLEFLFEFQRLLEPAAAVPHFPEIGERVGAFSLLTELGRGRAGRVFLARQPDLADRPVVLKVVPRSAGPRFAAEREHLSLARLQHPHIVPLLLAQEDADRDLLLLCMPYLGGTSLAHLLEGMQPGHPENWGRQLLERLDQFQSQAPVAWPSRGGLARSLLKTASLTQAICWPAPAWQKPCTTHTSRGWSTSMSSRPTSC